MSIKTKLISGLLSVTSIIMAAIFVVVGVNFSRQAMESAVQSASKEMAQVENSISIFLETCKMSADMLGKMPLARKADEVTTSFVKTTQKTKARPDADDAVGRQMVEVFTAMQATHPAYVEVFVGNENGGFVSSVVDGDMPAGYDPRKRPWYVDALKVKDRPSLSNAYMSTTGEAVTSATRVVVRDGQVIGVVGVDISLKNLTDLVKSIKLGQDGYLVLIQDNGLILADPHNDKNNFKKVGEVEDSFLAGLFKQGTGSLSFTSGDKDYLGIALTSAQSGWKLIGVINREEIVAPVRHTIRNLILLGAVSLVVIAATFWVFSTRVIISPLGRVKSFLERIGKGDYAYREKQDRTDEMGDIISSLNIMAEVLGGNLDEIFRKTQEAEQKAAQAEKAGREAEEARVRAEEAKSEGMYQAATRLEGVVSIVGSASQQLSSQIQESSLGAETQAQRVSETSTAMEQMTSTVLEVSRNASHAAETAEAARSKAQDGARVVSQVLDEMQELQQQSARLKQDMDNLGRQAQEIGRVLTVISDIADQTNLLALNAAIEAARAGDAGRGFAVVADEVRKLAEKTMTATKEVGDAITAIQASSLRNVENVERSVGLIAGATDLAGRSGQSLNEIVELVASTTDQVRAIATASEEQSAASEEINRSIEQVNAISLETSHSMTEAAKVVGKLAGQANALQMLIDELHGKAVGDSEQDKPGTGLKAGGKAKAVGRGAVRASLPSSGWTS